MTTQNTVTVRFGISVLSYWILGMTGKLAAATGLHCLLFVRGQLPFFVEENLAGDLCVLQYSVVVCGFHFLLLYF